MTALDEATSRVRETDAVLREARSLLRRADRLARDGRELGDPEVDVLTAALGAAAEAVTHRLERMRVTQHRRIKDGERRAS